MFTLWRRVNSRRTVHGLSKRAVLVARPDGSGVLKKFHAFDIRGIKSNVITTVDTRRPWLTKWRLARHSAKLDDVLPEVGEDYEVVAIPLWEQPLWARGLRLLVTIGIWLAILFGLPALGASTDAAILWSSLALPLLLVFLPRLGPVQVRSLDQLPLTAGNVVEYAQRRLSGAHPEALEERPHRERVLERIADIRAEYGELKLDVVKRIDRPALFDGAAEPTARFLSALVRAEDGAADLPLGALESLASELEVSFEVAKSNARAVGIAHLPEEHRDDARRAAKVARLAQESPNEGERRAAIEQLGRILESMALYYMPDVDEVRAIEAPSR